MTTAIKTPKKVSTELHPLFLRDLNEHLQREHILYLEKERPDLSEAIKNGEDIQVGVYFSMNECKSDKSSSLTSSSVF